MNKLNVVLITLLSLVFTSNVTAATSEVKWNNPDDYRDIHAGEGHRSKFKVNVFATLDKHIAKLVEKLPDNQKLMIQVSDLDLAGDVNAGGIRRIRIVKELFFPRIKFSYQLVDENNNEISTGEVNLKDMNFMMSSSLRYRNDFLGYEKQMLDDWFYKTLIMTK